MRRVDYSAAMGRQLAQTTDGLHPPKDLFHEFSFHADSGRDNAACRVVRRINRTASVDLLRHVGRDVPDGGHRATKLASMA